MTDWRGPLFMARLYPCRHMAAYAPMPVVNDTLYCRSCGTWRLCVEVSKAWRAVCRRRECRSWNYGADERSARRMAVRHQNRYPDHEVWIWLGGNVKDKLPAQPALIVTKT